MNNDENNNSNNNLDESESKIVPQRFIPFDIGSNISDIHRNRLESYFIKKQYIMCEIPELLMNICADIIYKINISTSLRLYIFSYGIGVFIFEDNTFILSDKYAVDYCEYRKEAHREILEFKHYGISELIKQIMSEIWHIIKCEKKHIRPSANDQWGYNGLSYVMTVSYIVTKRNRRNDYELFPDLEKKNLQIMLQPSLAHKEDTLALGKVDAHNSIVETSFDPYNFAINKIDAPKNWITAEDCAIYISWAAVVVYLNDIAGKYREVIEYLEVDLQAMWLYTYCQYINLKTCAENIKMNSAQLKKEKFIFQKKYNEFISDNNASIPAYIYEIRNELMKTSGIDQEKQNFIEYIEFCIDETLSYEGLQQRKYSVMNEVLLFIIAFIQIAPMMYSAMTGQYKNIAPWPIIVMGFFVIIAIYFIIKKD